MPAIMVVVGVVVGFLVVRNVKSWHAVGVWGNRPWPPMRKFSGCLFGFVCGVGVVVENCIVDASIFWFL